MRWFKKRYTYKIVSGSAGFIKLYKNGERIQPKNFSVEFRLKRGKK